MNIVTRQNWVSLFYMPSETPPGKLDLTAVIDDNFYHVTSVPTAELGTTPADVAEALVGISMAARWYKMDRRAILPGDAFTFDHTIWKFVPARAADKLGGTILMDFPFLAIVEAERKEPVCAVSI